MSDEIKKLGATDGAGEWDESEHPRDTEGKFTSGEGGGGKEDLRRHLTKITNNDIINTHNMKKQRIDILIDGFTDCLVERSSGKSFNTTVTKIDILPSDFKGWKFNWSKEAEDDVEVYALRISGEDKIQGLISTRVESDNLAIFVSLVETAPDNYGRNGKFEGVGGHLFAEAIKQSIDAGFEGFVYFRSKTNLISYYKKKLGAEFIGDNKMYIDSVAAYKLYNRYYGGVKK